MLEQLLLIGWLDRDEDDNDNKDLLSSDFVDDLLLVGGGGGGDVGFLTLRRVYFGMYLVGVA